jgi:hypothetical protein
MQFLFKCLFCSPVFVIIFNLIKYKSNVLEKLSTSYASARDFSPTLPSLGSESLFYILISMFSVGFLLLIFNFWKLLGIFSLIFSLIFYYLVLDADFFVFGMIGGLFLMFFENTSVKSVQIAKNVEKNDKKLKKSVKKNKNGSKVIKNQKVVDGKGVERPIPAVPVKEIADKRPIPAVAAHPVNEMAERWKKYDEKTSPARKKVEIFFTDRVIEFKNKFFSSGRRKTNVFRELVTITIVICGCVGSLVVVLLFQSLN